MTLYKFADFFDGCEFLRKLGLYIGPEVKDASIGIKEFHYVTTKPINSTDPLDACFNLYEDGRLLRVNENNPQIAEVHRKIMPLLHI